MYADVWRFVGDVTVHDLASPSLIDSTEYETLGVATLEEAKLTGHHRLLTSWRPQ